MQSYHVHILRWMVFASMLIPLFIEPNQTPFHVPTATSASPSLQDTPTALVSGEPISGFTLADPKLFWYTIPGCIPKLASAEPVDGLTEAISRIPTYGGEIRRLFYRGADEVGGPCGQQNRQFRPTSNIIADENYIYWIDGEGLQRLSTNANPGDAPEVLSANVQSNISAELAFYDNDIFALVKTGDFSNPSTTIRRITKTDGSTTTIATYPTGATRDLATDDTFVYWVINGSLRRYNPDTGGTTTPIANNVTSYYPEGTRPCRGANCTPSQYVFFAQGRQLFRYNNANSATSGALYTSSDTTASIFEITGDTTSIFFFEQRPLSCEPFCTYNDVLLRMGRTGGTAEPLYSANGVFSTPTLGLTTNGTFLFWNFDGLQRLPNDAEALPVVDMEITGLEVTQGIQSLSNTIQLIEDRRTFVRVYVRSKEAGKSVAGVTARLERVGNSPFGGLKPVNSVGPNITVKPSPDRNNLNDSFLFELPWSWTTGSLTLKATLNPFQYPLEPSYGADNQRNIAILFKPSPRLEVQFVAFGYDLNNQTYYPRLDKDIVQTYSWIRRAYPLATTPGFADDPSPGFRPSLWYVGDSNLGSYVDQSADLCDDLYPDDDDDPSLCASAYTNMQMDAMRDLYGISANVFMYGMISDAAGFFPRGQACCGDNVSTGPTGSGSWGWDFDGSYADWYAGHEIGHTLGRKHPAKNADNPETEAREGCGHSPSDPSYPYNDAKIGPSNGQIAGFDFGDPEFGIPRAVYPSSLWYDLMSYCNNQWISDYTYNGMYNFMMGNTTTALTSVAPQATDNFLGVYGYIDPIDKQAFVTNAKRLNEVASLPPIQAGDYSIKLLNSQNQVLADYPFTPEEVEDNEQPLLSFGQIVDFKPGTFKVNLVEIASGTVLKSLSVSANAPTINNVQVQSTQNPVDGTVTLRWNASDSDGDALTFDVFYSRDGGMSFQPVQMNTGNTSIAVDTTRLGGGNAIFRVIASDGVQSAQADSPPFTMANKPPQPNILTPGAGTTVQYGQLVNFSGAAFDLQDGSIPDNKLVWKNQKGTLGSGPLLSIDDLPVGMNKITLTATNSAGQSASAMITVIVEDDLTLPGPTLSVGPTQIGWHVGAGSTQKQNAQISISNAGNGVLTWSVSENAPWLTLSATSGTAPTMLTLTADPAGLPDGQTAETTLTITAKNGSQPVGTATIPVSLGVGDAYQNFRPTIPKQHVYLPLTVR
ncbi:MAG: hypothetical protein GFH27_549289n400 [Chloroflexi bacterium AL-W]|nr:hypothetical protein [Chloroflexi bacterium AL-N1]NOK67132.1 hypothetical protein [Chloroflexi bacterium AL-N10]NOK74575.1 hypothetical protein [Chloroflexi bacterium AL-N5]NOK81734.1 hypothetical protein [Chloroflexi bacterium AL-W]NOK89204.1 hypothetical protein [Chloroflexi bacterium AL-N15]